MVVLIENLELYIEDIYYPQPAKKISQIFDLLTDEIEIPLVFEDNFIDLKIFARNLFNKELSILTDSRGTIFLNLEPLDSFPFVSKSLKNTDIIDSLSKLRHVKIEITYILTKPQIIGSKFKQSSSVRTSIFPSEIHITPPLGCRISGPKEGHAIGFRVISRKSTKEISEDLYVHAPFIYEKHGKRVYCYWLYPEFYKIKEISDKTEEDTQIENNVEITYTSKIEPMAVIISLIIPFLFLCFSLVIITVKLNSMQFGIISEPNNSISFLILLMAYFYFHYSYIKEGHYIPYRYFFAVVLLIAIFAAFIWAFFGSNSPDLLQIVNESNVSQIVNGSNLDKS